MLSRKKFVKDLTRTRHMTAVSVVVLATTFMPLLGIPDIDELRAFRSAAESFSAAHARAPARDDEAARERSAASVIGRDSSGAVDVGPSADRVLVVQRPERDQAEVLEVADILPLPPIEETERVAMEETERAVVAQPEPAVMEEEHADLPTIEEEPEAVVEDEPLNEDEEALLEEEEL